MLNLRALTLLDDTVRKVRSITPHNTTSKLRAIQASETVQCNSTQPALRAPTRKRFYSARAQDDGESEEGGRGSEQRRQDSRRLGAGEADTDTQTTSTKMFVD